MVHWVFIINALGPVQLVPRTVDNNSDIPDRVLMSYSSWSAEKVPGPSHTRGRDKSLYNATLSAEI